MPPQGASGASVPATINETKGSVFYTMPRFPLESLGLSRDGTIRFDDDGYPQEPCGRYSEHLRPDCIPSDGQTYGALRVINPLRAR